MAGMMNVIVNGWEGGPSIVIACFVVIGGIVGQIYYKRRTRRKRWNAVGKDVVALHSIKCRKSIPNLGPFVVKLETFFKMAGIKYETDTDQPIGPKGKIPWITFNGKDYSDSQLIVEFLSDYFKKDFSGDLNIEDQAIARSMQIMAEEHLYWGLVSWRYIEDPAVKVFEMTDLFPTYMKLLFPLVRLWFKSILRSQGIGRHTIEERRSIITKDIVALSQYLGKKSFFMGETPREIDCCLYGQLSQFVWNTPGSPYETLIKEECRNIEEYCNRMKNKYFIK